MIRKQYRKPQEIIDELSFNSAPEVQKIQMSDYAEQELERIYRKRSRYEYNSVVAHLQQKLTEEIELVPPERVTEADAVLFGDVQ